MKKFSLTICTTIILAMAFAPTTQAQTPRGFVYSVDNFTLRDGDNNFKINSQTLQSWQGLTSWISTSPLQNPKPDLKNNIAEFFGLISPAQTTEATAYHYNVAKIYDYLKTVVATTTDQSMTEPKLTITDNKVSEFVPPQTGRELDVLGTALKIADALEQNQTSADLIVYEVRPTKNLADTNTLGIKELVAQGLSNFSGSPKNRRFNINVGVEKMKGVLVAPGGEFSFDDNLGPVDGEHGFLPELVIKGKEGTIPEFGGGLCQVSTTTFRAAMAAGLPITARRNHAYAVQYYSPQGTDATIYPGSADLKFINDTPGYILIWPYLKDKNNLAFDFYGTKDSRQVTLEKPVVYDRKPDGSMKATWTRDVVMADGKTRTDVFKSVYQPPALFHKTEEFATSTSAGLSMPKTN